MTLPQDTQRTPSTLRDASWADGLDSRTRQVLDVCGVQHACLDDQTIRFGAVPVAEHFSKARTNLLIRRTAEQPRCQCFVDSDLAYQGTDSRIAAALQGPCHRNWRRLRHIEATGPVSAVLQGVLQLLRSPIALLLRAGSQDHAAAGSGPSHAPGAGLLATTSEPRSADALAQSYRSCFRKPLARRLAVVATRTAPPCSSVVWGRSGVGLGHLISAAAHVLLSLGHVQRVRRLLGPRLTVGSVFAAEKEAMVMRMLDEAVEDRHCLLLVEHLDLCLPATATVWSLLTDACDRGLRLMATVREHAYLRELQSDEAVARRLLPVRVDQPTHEQTVDAVQQSAGQFAVTVPMATVQAAVAVTTQAGSPQPAAAIGALNAALAEAAWRKRQQVSPDDVLSGLQPQWPE